MSLKVLNESDLIFSSASTALKDALGDLRRKNLTIRNRLRSIHADAEFVQEIAHVFDLPLVANERCGSWYIPPNNVSLPHDLRVKAGSVYFKSTDGHFHQWAFSLRRLNLQILELIGENGGCIIVDSTRRGKSMPDALSKTVPIWITVLNRLIFPERTDFHNLHTPQDVVSASEHSQIEERVEDFVLQARKLALDCDDLRKQLGGRPMTPVWQRPGETILEHRRDEAQNYIVLCTASNCTSAESSSDSDYVQGAADDHETWALGMDATTFWSNKEALLDATDADLPELISKAAKRHESESHVEATPIKPTDSVWVSSNTTALSIFRDFDYVIMCSTAPVPALQETLKTRFLHLSCTDGKIGSRQLRTELTKIDALSATLAGSPVDQSPKILVSCHTGIDLAIGTALAIICKLCNDAGCLDFENESSRKINKDMIKQRLSWIMIAMPHAKPSRATLQSVNHFLMA